MAPDALVAGAIAAAASGIPSTVVALARGEDVLDGARAAGAMLAPRARSTPALLAAAVPVHLALSLGWAAALARLPGPPRLACPTAALAIAALDLRLIAPRRFPAVAALPQGRQWADHLAFGATVGAVLTHRRHRPRTSSNVADLLLWQ